MPSEYDPLLPKNPPTPEITGYGFSSPKKSTSSAEIEYIHGSFFADENHDSYRGLEGNKLDFRGPQHTSQDLTRGSIFASADNNGYGTAGNQKVDFRDFQPYDPNEGRENGGDNTSESSEDSSVTNAALRQIIAIFMFVVGFAFLLSILVPGGLEDGEGPGGARKGGPWLVSVTRRPSPSMSIPERAAKILDETPLIDGHNDLAIFLRYAYGNKIHTKKFKEKWEHGGLPQHVDIPRLRQGGVGGAFWSTFVLCPNNASYDYSDRNYATAVSQTLSQIDLVSRLQSYYPSVFSPGTTSLSDHLASFSANNTILGPLSIEGLHQISPSAPLSTLRLYYSLGVRAATLTWNCHNAFADAAMITDIDPEKEKMVTTVATNYRNGITPLGRTVIREMNRLGMLVDLSHTSYWTQLSVLSNSTSLAPIIYTHSSVFSLCPHPRNVHDNILDLVKSTNSLVMINFSPDFISCLPPPNSSVIPEFYDANSTIHQVARHITYIGNKIGFDHVGLGSDFDGIETTPRGLEDVSKFRDLVELLLGEDFAVSDKDVSKIVGGNLVRVWKKADEVAAKMRSEGMLEGEDGIPELTPGRMMEEEGITLGSLLRRSL